EFGKRGLDLEQGAVAELARRVQQSAIKGQLVAALDDWADVDARLRKRLQEVTRRADPNPVREAVDRGETEHLFRLADELDVGRHHPTTLFVLGREVARAGGDPVPLWRRAQQRYPQDFWLNFMLGQALRKQESQRAEAVGYFRAAVASRPHSSAAHK